LKLLVQVSPHEGKNGVEVGEGVEVPVGIGVEVAVGVGVAVGPKVGVAVGVGLPAGGVGVAVDGGGAHAESSQTPQ